MLLSKHLYYGEASHRVFGFLMMIVQILGTVLLFPLVMLGGPGISFFWWVAFIVWIVCILAGHRRPAPAQSGSR